MIEDTIPPYNTIQYRWDYAMQMLQSHAGVLDFNSPEGKAWVQFNREYLYAVLNNQVTEEYLERGITVLRELIQTFHDKQDHENKIRAALKETPDNIDGYNYAESVKG